LQIGAKRTLSLPSFTGYRQVSLFSAERNKRRNRSIEKKNWIETLFLTEQQLSPLKRLSFCVCFLRYQLFGWGGSSIHRKKYWASLDHHFKLN
jgi:hypothetical protein